MFASLDFLGNNAWITQVCAVIFITLAVNFFQKRFFIRLHRKLKKTPYFWDDALLSAALAPSLTLVWFAGLYLVCKIISGLGDNVIFDSFAVLFELAVIIIFTWFLIRLTGKFQDNIIRLKEAANKPVDYTLVDAVAKLIRLTVIITATLVVMQKFGYDASAIFAFGGMGGIVVGFAARDLLANFFGGIIIYMDRPFVIGDWIRSPDRDIEGTVERIGWRMTVIRTFDKRPLYLPNSVFSNIAVENPSRMSNRRITQTIGVRYADAGKINSIVKDVRRMLEEHEEIASDQTLIVNFDQFSPSSLDFFIYTFTKTIDWVKFHQVKQDVLLKIIDIITAHGAECAFPTSTLDIQSPLPVTQIQGPA